jgi:hypothetical protein
MTGISNTITSAADAQREHERIALAALTMHIFERALEVPHSITVDRYGLNARTVMLSVHRESAEAWMESLAVDSDTTKPVENTDLFGKPMVRRTVTGRLPDIGIRVTLRFFEPAPKPAAPTLQSVKA